jgi:hypothetical protein
VWRGYRHLSGVGIGTGAQFAVQDGESQRVQQGDGANFRRNSPINSSQRHRLAVTHIQVWRGYKDLSGVMTGASAHFAVQDGESQQNTNTQQSDGANFKRNSPINSSQWHQLATTHTQVRRRYKHLSGVRTGTRAQLAVQDGGSQQNTKIQQSDGANFKRKSPINSSQWHRLAATHTQVRGRYKHLGGVSIVTGAQFAVQDGESQPDTKIQQSDGANFKRNSPINSSQ